MPTLDRNFVSTMADVRARAEFLANLTRDAYREAARHACGLTRSDRAQYLLKAREYDRRAKRVAAWRT